MQKAQRWATRQTFAYDNGLGTSAFGNINKNSFAALYNNKNQITNMGMTYDANGNVTTDSVGNTYTYDANWQTRTGFNTSTFIYDAFGRMVERSYNNQPMLYSPVGKLGYLTSGGSFGSGAEVHIPTPAGDFEYIGGNNTANARVNHPDWLGSVRVTTNPASNRFSDGTEYAPFGETYNSNGTNYRLDFTGQDQDSLPSGSYDFLARKYSAIQGRWLVPDPAGLAAMDLADPQTFNQYAYVGNNPLALIDPFGLCDELTICVTVWAPLPSEFGFGSGPHHVAPVCDVDGCNRNVGIAQRPLPPLPKPPPPPANNESSHTATCTAQTFASSIGGPQCSGPPQPQKSDEQIVDQCKQEARDAFGPLVPNRESILTTVLTTGVNLILQKTWGAILQGILISQGSRLDVKAMDYTNTYRSCLQRNGIAQFTPISMAP